MFIMAVEDFRCHMDGSTPEEDIHSQPENNDDECGVNRLAVH